MRSDLLMVTAGGAILGLSWLPVLPPTLYPVGFLLYLMAFSRVQSGRQALGYGLLLGAVRYLVAAHFLLALLRYSYLAIAFYLMAIAFILPFAALESWGAYWFERRTGLPRAIAFALIWSILEKVRTLGDLSFPADLAAHGMGSAPAWLSLSRWTGPFFVSLWAILVAAGLQYGWRLARSRRWPAALAAASLALALFGAPRAAAVLLPERAGQSLPELGVGIVQPCARIEEKSDQRRWGALWKRNARLTRRVAPSVDLVVWPETARPGAVTWKEHKPFDDEQVRALAREIRRPILYGAELFCWRGTRRRHTGHLYNGAALIRAENRGGQWYGKQRLLPFAEGVPFGDLVGWDPSRRGHSQGVLSMLGNFSPGPQPTIFRVGQARIGVLVCYEGLYPGLARRYRRDGANVLALLTNDAWWGRSVFPAWHAAMISNRALEDDLPIIRAANNGVSSVTDRFGRVTAHTALSRVTTLSAKVAPASTRPTFYAARGDWIVALELLVLAGALLRGLFRRTTTAPAREH